MGARRSATPDSVGETLIRADAAPARRAGRRRARPSRPVQPRRRGPAAHGRHRRHRDGQPARRRGRRPGPHPASSWRSAAPRFGAAWAAIPAVLKVVTRTNEAISSLLLNYIAGLIVDLARASSRGRTRPSLGQAYSRELVGPERFPIIWGHRVHAGIFVAPRRRGRAVARCCARRPGASSCGCSAATPTAARRAGLAVGGLSIAAMVRRRGHGRPRRDDRGGRHRGPPPARAARRRTASSASSPRGSPATTRSSASAPPSLLGAIAVGGSGLQDHRRPVRRRREHPHGPRPVRRPRLGPAADGGHVPDARSRPHRRRRRRHLHRVRRPRRDRAERSGVINLGTEGSMLVRRPRRLRRRHRDRQPVARRAGRAAWPARALAAVHAVLVLHRRANQIAVGPGRQLPRHRHHRPVRPGLRRRRASCRSRPGTIPGCRDLPVPRADPVRARPAHLPVVPRRARLLVGLLWRTRAGLSPAGRRRGPRGARGLRHLGHAGSGGSPCSLGGALAGIGGAQLSTASTLNWSEG